MADLAASVVHKTQARGRNAAQIANGVTLYEGALVGLEAGYLNHWADGANDVFWGVLLGPGIGLAVGAALTGNTSATPPPEGQVDTSGVVLMHLDSVAGQVATTIANQGDLVYCATSNTDDMTLVASGHTHPIGWISRWRATDDIDVQLFTPAEMLAQATA